VGAGAGVRGGWSVAAEIARRLGINRRTVARLAASEGPPRYRRASTGSQLDLLEPVLRLPVLCLINRSFRGERERCVGIPMSSTISALELWC
jgi:hypothetical protein